MECTPDTYVHFQSCKDQTAGVTLFDSGYADVLRSPRRASEAKDPPCKLLSSDQFHETPKENLSLFVTPKKERAKPSIRPLDDVRGAQRPLQTSGWCETPKVGKRDALLRRRLHMCKPSTDVKPVNTGTPCTGPTESSLSARTEHCVNAFSVSQDNALGALSSSTLTAESDVVFSVRKRRLFFSQVRTSTLRDGKHNVGDLSSFEKEISFLDADPNDGNDSFGNLISEQWETPHSGKLLPLLAKEYFQTPVSSVAVNLCDTPSVLSTPSTSHIPKYNPHSQPSNRSVSEDSGFGSLTHDKSQDSLVDHDDSFQELLLSSAASRRNCETPLLAETKRRSRLQRQHRLSTLREGGSHSDDDIRNISQTHAGKTDQHFPQCPSPLAENVFVMDNITPHKSPTIKQDNKLIPLGMTSAKLEVIPLQTTIAKPHKSTPVFTDPACHNVTPLRITPLRYDNLSLTPALQLVHAMCQKNAQMLHDQSPSLEEHLRSAAVLAETTMFRTTMPLAGLIGRKMGLGKIDVLKELKKRKLRHILTVILNHLSPEDIYRFGQVSESWNEIILHDKKASCKRKVHLNAMEVALERGDAIHVPDAETRLTLVKRSVLGSVQARSRDSSFCAPQSGKGILTPSQHSTSHSGSSTKQEKFIQVAKTLFEDECLKPCPRCQHPAKCHTVKNEGVCSRDDCGFQFCTACLCAFHGSKVCASRSAGRRNKKDTLLPGSAQSKRNLRRL
ncbi:F-box only protein 43 [Lampris incognitus]|uniref:F-box only protein 43 n=1 Tax=Lampris incognitus TaxID=2546036 RepID=UPI0024B56B6E|nr:F-box only protein 43 [Lampris incognitus]